MSKFFLLLIGVLMTGNLIAKEKESIKNHKKYKPNPHSIFDVIPLNSPVKETIARFLIKTPERFDIDEVSYQVKNSGRIFERPKQYQRINLIEGSEGKELRINVSKLPPGFYQLLVKVKDRSRKEHHFRSKFKDHAMFVIDSSLQVPLPNSKKNDATIAGVDSDNDGIRDDIQRWINEDFSNRPKIKMALRQVAISRQQDLLSVGNKEQSIIASKNALDSNNCLYTILGLDEGAKLLREIDEKILNTKDRLYADMKSNANFSGQAYTTPNTIEGEKSLCSFDPESL